MLSVLLEMLQKGEAMFLTEIPNSQDYSKILWEATGDYSFKQFTECNRLNLLNKWAQQYSDQRSLKLSSVAWCNIVFSNYLWMRCWFMKQICLPQNQSEYLILIAEVGSCIIMLLQWQQMDK